MADNVVQVIIRAKDETKGAFSSAAVNTKALVAGLTAITAASVAVSTAAFKLAKDLSVLSDQFLRLNAQTGLSIETLSQLRVAAAQNETDLQAVGNGIRFLNRSLLDLAEGGTEVVATFERLKLSAEDFAGLDTEQKLQKVAEGLATIGDRGERSALAMRIFGRAGAELIPFLDAIASGAVKVGEEGENLGVTISRLSVILGDEFGDQLTLLQGQMDATKAKIATAVIPAFLAIFDAISPVIIAFGQFSQANQGLLRELVKLAVPIAAVGSAIIGLVAALAALKAGLAVLGLSLAVAGGPLAILAGVVIGVAAAIVALRAEASKPFEIGEADLSSVETMGAAIERITEETKKAKAELAGISGVLGGLGGESIFANNLRDAIKLGEDNLKLLEEQRDAALEQGAAYSFNFGLLGKISREKEKQSDLDAKATAELRAQQAQQIAALQMQLRLGQSYKQIVEIFGAITTETEKQLASGNAVVAAQARQIQALETRLRLETLIAEAQDKAAKDRQERITTVTPPPAFPQEVTIGPPQEQIEDFREAIESLGVSYDALAEKAQAAGTTIEGSLTGVSLGLEIIRARAQDSLALTLEVAVRTAQAFDSFAENLAGSMTDLFQSFFDFSISGAERLRNFVQSLIGTVKRLVADILQAILKAAILKAIFGGPLGFLGFNAGGSIGRLAREGSGLFAGPAFAAGGSIARGQSGFSILGRGGRDSVPALLAPGEVVLPTIGGMVPADVVSGLARLGERLEMFVSGQSGRREPVTQNHYHFHAPDTADAYRTARRHGLVAREEERIFDLYG